MVLVTYVVKMKVYSKRDNIAIFHILNNYYLSYMIRPVSDRPFAFFDKLKNKTDTYRLNNKMERSHLNCPVFVNDMYVKPVNARRPEIWKSDTK